MSTPQTLEMLAQQRMAPMKGWALGAPFLGVCFDSLLMGVIICQMTHWVPNASKDPRHVRTIIGVVFAAALVGTAFTMSTYFTAFVLEFGQYSRFASLEYFGWYGVLDALIVIPVQIFFAERAVRINGNSVFLMISCAVLILATAVMCVTTTVSTRGQNIFNRTDVMIHIATAWPGVCILAHFWITSAILWGLFHTRSASEHANRLVTRVIYVAVESQLPSTFVAFLIMLTILIDHKSPLIPFIVIVHPKIFAVGCLAMVNTRHSWRSTGKVITSFGSSGGSRMSRSSPTHHVSLGSTVDDIGLHTPKHEMDDVDRLRHQQSVASMMEAGMPLQELTMDGSKHSNNHNPFN